MWKLRSNATTLTVSSCPGSGIIGCLQTQQRGANFLKNKKQNKRFKTIDKQILKTMNILVKIFDAVNLICGINGERNAIQTFAANNATETFRMIWFAGGP